MGIRHDLELLDCPRCGLPAEVIGRFTLPGVDGDVEHVAITCILGHGDTAPSQSARPAPRSGGLRAYAAASQRRANS